METLQITKVNAIKAFKGASKEVKKTLTDLFGEKTFSEKITDRVKTFQDALDVDQNGVSEKELVERWTKLGLPDDEIGYRKLKIITKALNEGWEPDWDNSNEYKYWPYFNMGSSGFGFSVADCVVWFADTGVGSRLCFKSRELAEFAAKQFVQEYKDFMTI